MVSTAAARQFYTAKSKGVAATASLSPASRQGHVAMRFSMSPVGNSKLPAARLLRKPALTKRSTVPNHTALDSAPRSMLVPDFHVARGTVAASSSDTPGSRPGSNSVLRHPNPAEAHPLPDPPKVKSRSWTNFGGKGAAEKAASHTIAERPVAPASPGPAPAAPRRIMEGEPESTAPPPAQSNQEPSRQSRKSQRASVSGSTVKSSITKAYLPDAAALKACSPFRNVCMSAAHPL